MFKIQVQDAYENVKLALEDPYDVQTRIQNSTDMMRKQEALRLVGVCTSECSTLKAAITQLVEGRQSWAEYVRKLPTATRPAAEAELTEVERVIDAEVVQRAKKRIRDLERVKLNLQLEFDQLSIQLGQTVNDNGNRIAELDRSAHVQLPTLRLQPFDGNRKHWPEFNENFTTTVHSSSMSKIQKMTYLRTLLTGDAKTVIEGLALTEANYDLAMELLTKKYDRKDDVIRELYHEISTLRTCRTFEDCKTFANKLEVACRQLEVMGESVNSPLVYLALEQKLSQPMLREMLKAKESTKPWSTSEFRKKLHTMIEKEEEFQRVNSFNHVESASQPRAPVKHFMREYPSSRPHSQNNGPFRTQPTNLACAAPNQDRFPSCPNALFSKPTMRKPENRERTSHAEPRCAFCDQGHNSEECRQYATAEARSNRASEIRLCFKCLAKGHMMRECPRPTKCRICNRAHHAAVCKAGRDTQRTQVSTAATVSSPTGRVLLMTAAATLENPRDQQKRAEVTVFFDTGSHRSFVTKEVAQKLGLESGEPEKLSLCTFGASKPAEVTSPRVYVKMQTRKGRLGLHLSVIDEIIPMPVTMAVANEGLRHIEYQGRFIEESLSDRQPDVLIGIDHIHLFQISSETRLDNGFMVSSSTLGTIVSGKENCSSAVSRRDVVLLSTESKHSVCKDSELFDLVQNHFDLEKAGTEEDLLADEDTKVVDEFNRSLKLNDGRYEVALPWKSPRPVLNSNYYLSRGRLRSTMRTLQKRPELLEQYHQTMMDQLEKGIIEKIPENEVNQGTIIHYLPHQAVIREDKTHTKLRVVYDGSAKTGKDCASINQCLHRGPLLLCDLVGILLRFRIPKVCIVADIEKAFLQLSLAPKDRDACRFIWTDLPESKDWEKHLSTYRFKRVTFGLICSPFLLAAAVKEHLKRENSSLADNIRENIYVDNIVIHSDSSENTRKLCEKAKGMFARVSMNLREFASNDRQAIKQLPDEDRLPSSSVKLLGLQWDTERDLFVMSIKNQECSTLTKRIILQRIAEVFDPLGWTTPAMLSARIFFQKLWKLKLSWDADLPNEAREEWLKIRESWNHQITISRRLFSEVTGQLELHVFADASKDAFGAAAFIRCSSVSEGKARLVLSKCRVKALNSTATIPKLELQALKLAATVAKFVQSQMDISEVRLWTDSQCVIGWLNSSTKQERFVENRVKIIRNYHVSYVRTEENPADLLTRGLTFKELAECQKWWTGPDWLDSSEETCKGPGPHFDPEEFANRVERTEAFHVSCQAAEIVETPKGIIPVERISSWSKAGRIAAYVLKFIEATRNKVRAKGENLSAKEVSSGRLLLIREAQARVPPTKEVKKNLELFLDENQIWRCQGRIGKCQLTVNAQTPIWLPRDDRTTELIVMDSHKKAFHAGANTTLAKLRSEYWLAQGRRKIRSIVRKLCMICRKHNVHPYKLPKMTDLPEKRVTPSRPFENTGLDYFGPISVKVTKESETAKVWVCIFTCFVSRAVHLEIAHDLSAEAFISAFKRFIARRGTPKTLMSDNGTNFKLASKVVVDAWREVITSKATQETAAERGIEWKFIAERAPWRGGFWERLIGIVKSGMKKTIGRKILKTDELHTIITEIEMIVNSRPLTYQSETDVELPLRPIDLIIPHDLSSDTPRVEEQDANDPTYYDKYTPRDKLTETFKAAVRRVDQFWQAWSEEYLVALRERQKSLEFSQGATSNRFPKLGEVVLVQENDSPRNEWRLALIEELLPGSDREIRTVRIRYGHRSVVRAINVLYPLEISNQEKGQGGDRVNDKNPQPYSVAHISCIALNVSENSRRMNVDDYILVDVSDYELDYEEDESVAKVVEQVNDENEPPAKIRVRADDACSSRKEAINASVSSSGKVERKSGATVPSHECEKEKATAPPRECERRGPISSRIAKNKGVASVPSSKPKFRVTVPTRTMTITKDFDNGSRIVAGNAICLPDSSSPIWTITKGDRSGWELTDACYGHFEHCTGITVNDIARQIHVKNPPNFGQGIMWPIKSVLQAAFVRWGLRQVCGEVNGPQVAYYIQQMCQADPIRAVKVHQNLGEIAIGPKAWQSADQKSSTFDGQDLRFVCDLWRSKCMVAGTLIQDEPWKPVKYLDDFSWINDHSARTDLMRASRQLERVLTGMRKEDFYPASKIVGARCVVVGDDLIRGATLHLKGVYYVEAEIKKTADELDQLYFDSHVQHIIICTGMSVTRNIHTVATYEKCLTEVGKIAERIRHVKWWIIPPPDKEKQEDRSRRISEVLSKVNQALTVVQAFGKTNIWSRVIRSDKELPLAEDYERIFRRVFELGVDVLPLEKDDQGRATINERLKTLVMHLRAGQECREHAI